MKNIAIQFTKFCLVGLTNIAADLSLLNLFILIFHLNVYVSATISFLLVGFNSFYWNGKWTFNALDKNKIWHQFAKFMIFNSIGLLINNGFMFFFISQHELNYNLAKLLATLFVLFWNFSTSKYWTFKKNSKLV